MALPFSAQAQTHPKSTLALGAVAGALLAGAKGALFGGLAGGVLVGAAALKKLAKSPFGYEDPSYNDPLKPWEGVSQIFFGQDDDSGTTDAGDVSSDDSVDDGSGGSYESGTFDDARAFAQLPTDSTDTSVFDVSEDDSGGYAPGAGGMAATPSSDTFTRGDDLPDDSQDDVWSTSDDNPEDEYGEGPDEDDASYAAGGAVDGGGSDDGAYDGGGGGGSGGGSGGGGGPSGGGAASGPATAPSTGGPSGGGPTGIVPTGAVVPSAGGPPPPPSTDGVTDATALAATVAPSPPPPPGTIAAAEQADRANAARAAALRPHRAPPDGTVLPDGRVIVNGVPMVMPTTHGGGRGGPGIGPSSTPHNARGVTIANARRVTHSSTGITNPLAGRIATPRAPSGRRAGIQPPAPAPITNVQHVAWSPVLAGFAARR